MSKLKVTIRKRFEWYEIQCPCCKVGWWRGRFDFAIARAESHIKSTHCPQGGLK